MKRARTAAVVLGGVSAAAIWIACGDPDPVSGGDAGVDAPSDALQGSDSAPDVGPADAGPSDVVDATPCVEDASASPFLDDVVDLGVSYQHACAVRANGKLWCWGSLYSYVGEVPVTEADGGAVAMKKTRGGSSFQCGLDVIGRVWCWGHNGSGQLGKPAASVAFGPTLVGTGSSAPFTATDIAAGATSICVITTQNKVACWGDANGGFGAFDGGAGPSHVPFDTGITVQSGAKIVGNPNGSDYCVIDGATTTCFGSNGSGQLAIAATPSAVSTSAPAAVADAGGALPLRDLGIGNPSCAVDQGGKVYCWGYCGDSCGQQPIVVGPTAHVLDGLGDAGASQISVGGGFTCTRTTDGRVFCVGDNFAETLGAGYDSGISSTKIPRMVVDFDGGGALRHVTSITSGGIFSCALLENSCGKASPGHVACWGFNGGGGILGDVEAGTKSPVPIRVRVR